MASAEIFRIKSRCVIGNTCDVPLERLPENTVTIEQYHACGGLTVRAAQDSPSGDHSQPAGAAIDLAKFRAARLDS